MNNKDCLDIARLVTDLPALKLILPGKIKQAMGRKRKVRPGTWPYFLMKLERWIAEGMPGNVPFSVFVRGNKKLPFVAFSSLPFIDCPGMGPCGVWCYSRKAWRYPAAFCRQVQNSLLVRYRFETIAKAWEALPADIMDLRLYVDGDFPSVEILRAWMELIKTKPEISVYGYSKSWKEFLSLNATGFEWPQNYRLNLSSGSRHEKTGIANAIRSIAPVRGQFVAVPVDHRHIKSKAYQDKANPGSKEYRAEVFQKLKLIAKKVFPCPGNCGNCLPGGRHACGSEDFKGVTIGIGIHA